MKVYTSLMPEQATLYEAIVKDMLEQIESSEGIQRKGLVLSSLTKLKQVCNHPAHFLGDQSALDNRSGKLARLTEMLDEVVAAGDHALVFTQYAEWGRLLQTYLARAAGQGCHLSARRHPASYPRTAGAPVPERPTWPARSSSSRSRQAAPD